jgi:hypothetical protein
MAILSSLSTHSSSSNLLTTHLATLTTTPPFLPPSDEELTSSTWRESINSDALLTFQLALVGALKGVFDYMQERKESSAEAAGEDEGEKERKEEDGRIACAVARWDITPVRDQSEGEGYEEEEKLDGWIVPIEGRVLVKCKSD